MWDGGIISLHSTDMSECVSAALYPVVESQMRNELIKFIAAVEGMIMDMGIRVS